MSVLETTRPDVLPVDALLAGDERTVRGFVAAHHSTMLRVASTYVASRVVADDIVQETWRAIIDALPGFDARCSAPLERWIYTILVDHARGRAAESHDVREAGPAVDADRFLPEGHRRAGHWSQPPRLLDSASNELDDDELRRVCATAIDVLPPDQHRVLWLRDVCRWTAADVCAVLGLADAEQRLLLHRGRNALRAALERHVAAR